ncbi:MAG: hypothetical protein QM664_07990 [Flavihumibacter sp.]
MPFFLDLLFTGKAFQHFDHLTHIGMNAHGAGAVAADAYFFVDGDTGGKAQGCERHSQ